MSETSKAARSAMKSKAERLVRTDPNERVDASGYTPPDALDADVKTGMRPISKRQFKRGGKVHGEQAKKRADRVARKSGGRAEAFMNRNEKEANEERTGSKHVGGFKRGGEAHSDKKEDEALIRKEVKASALKRKSGGSVSDGAEEGTRPVGGREARARGGQSTWGGSTPMRLIKTHKAENGRMSKVYRDPDWGEYRVKHYDASGKMIGESHHDDAEDAHNTAQHEVGREERKSGGRTKGKTNINIIIGGHGQQQPPAPPPMMPPPHPPMMPPPGPPPGLGAPGGPPPGGPAPLNAPMPRKSGGRAFAATKALGEHDTGSGGGLGRLKKIETYGDC